MTTIKYSAESLSVCRLADIACLLNNLEAQRDEMLAALKRVAGDTDGDCYSGGLEAFVSVNTAAAVRAAIAKVRA